MIALDSNLLLRLFVRDDAEQFRQVHALLATCTEATPAFVPREVVVEFVWVLRRTYRLSREAIVEAVDNLLAMPGVALEAGEAIGQALNACREGGADLPDLMILAAARRAGCDTLYTFDRRLAREPGATLLEAT